jgi:hypothetical protein
VPTPADALWERGLWKMRNVPAAVGLSSGEVFLLLSTDWYFETYARRA